jgi:hypothetical protein
LKTTRDYVNIIDAYNELGSYRAAARLCGTTDKTVRRTIERQQAGGPLVPATAPGDPEHRPGAVGPGQDAIDDFMDRQQIAA